MTLRPCGTVAAYRRHLRAGDRPCDECTRAVAEYDRLRRWRNGTRRPLQVQPCGTWGAHQRHRTRGESPCEQCREAANRYHRDLNRRRAEGRITVASVICDVLETVGTSMSLLSVAAWVLELHPEWSEATVQRTLYRMVGDGRVVRVEFGDEIRYRLP